MMHTNRRYDRILFRGLSMLLMLMIAWMPAGERAAAADDDTDPNRPQMGGDVQTGVVVVKLRAQAQQALSLQAGTTGLAGVDKLSQRHQVYAVEPAFPFLARSTRKRASDLRQVYYVRYDSPADPRAVAADFDRLPEVAYAEPLQIHRLHDLPSASSPSALIRAVLPNDPLVNQMDHLQQVNLPEAWEVVQAGEGLNGDPNDRVIIAIIDGGTDWQHADLAANVWTNPDEIPGNGIDDDENGYPDDVHGWNFANESGDPTGLPNTPNNAQHGTVVAGIAAAVADNSLGVAGSSWNAQFMPINAGCPDTDNAVCTGYTGIVYAAENGAHIANASWGGPGVSRLAQDVIDFAVENGTLVVTSAGNGPPPTGLGTNNDRQPQNPANLFGVLSVGATNKADDQKASYSNYGRSVDVFAPGSSLNSSYPNDRYDDQLNGTSFSAPFVAGITALVKTQRPAWSMAQVREQLRVTADPIDDANPSFQGRMGQGRANALRAVTEFDHPAIRTTDVAFTDADGNGAINREETITLTLTYTNFLADAADVTFRLTTSDDRITVLQGEATAAALAGGASTQVPFTFSIGADTPNEYTLAFFAEVSSGDYTDATRFQLLANPASVQTHDTGPVQVSLTEEGNIGWTTFSDDFDPESRGVGFVYRGDNYLFEGGLLVGNSPGRISDAVRGVQAGAGQEEDFVPASGSVLEITRPGALAHEEGLITLVDSPAPIPLGISIEQESFADTSDARDDFVIFKYSITNTGTTTLTDVHAGLFFDWDLNADASDYARFDADRRMGMAQNAAASPTVLMATKLLTTNADVSFRAINNETEIYGGDAGNGFTNGEKWTFLSSGVQRTDLDQVDVSTLLGAGPVGLKPGCTFDMAFAVIGGNSTEAVQQSADAAQSFWQSTLSEIRPNRAPTFVTADGVQLAVPEGQSIAFDFEATDPNDCDVLAYSLEGDVPANATINGQTGQFLFTPGFEQEGLYAFNVVVTDGRDEDQIGVVIEVTETNRPPVFERVLSDTLITAAQTLQFTFDMEDPDGDGVTYRIVDPVDNASIDAQTGTFIFAPEVDQVGEFVIRVEGTDGSMGTTAEATVTVVAPEFKVAGAYPSPFSPAEGAMTIEFQLPAQGTVTVQIFDLLGRAVATLVDGELPPGPRRLRWTGVNDAGQPLASGVYFYRITAEADGQAYHDLQTLLLVR